MGDRATLKFKRAYLAIIVVHWDWLRCGVAVLVDDAVVDEELADIIGMLNDTIGVFVDGMGILADVPIMVE